MEDALEELSVNAIRNGLGTHWLGQAVVCYETIDSTNTLASTLAQQGAVEGTLVIANAQTAGRGRLGRRWTSPPGSSLLFSLVFRPALEMRRVQGLTMVCGLGVRQAMRELTGLPAQLKWPNDLMLRGRKVGGVLTELGAVGTHLDYAVVGVGLNVNWDAASLPKEFHATSLQHELGRPSARIALLQAALLAIERRYLALQAGEWPVREWAAALDTLGQRVELRTGEGILRGLAQGVDEEGALLVRGDDGGTRRVLVGDVVLPGQETAQPA
jgi:BirA family biotin operon repressor/biotin-[acetyl-CoA-carboxylase] ligase